MKVLIPAMASPNNPDQLPLLLSQKDTAMYLGKSERTVRELVKKGAIRPMGSPKHPSYPYKFAITEVARYAKGEPIPKT